MAKLVNISMIAGFIYKWIDSKTGLIYIGRHKGSIDDGYLGSGVYFKEAYNLRPNDFTREILWESSNTTPEELIAKEKEYIDPIPIDHLFRGSDPKYYNAVKNSEAGGTIYGDLMKHPESIKKMLKTRGADYPTPYDNVIAKYGEEKWAEIQSRNLKGNKRGAGNKNKPKSEEHKCKIANSIKAKYANGDYDTDEGRNANAGRKPAMDFKILEAAILKYGIRGAAKELGLSYYQCRDRYYRAKRKR